MSAATRGDALLPGRPAMEGARITQGALLGLVAALPLVLTPWGADAYNETKVLVLYGMAALVLATWLVLSALRAAPTWRATLPELPLWAFLFTVLLATATSVHLRLSLFGAPGRYEGTLALGAYAILYLAAAHFSESAAAFRTLAVGAGSTAAAAIAYGIAQVWLPPLFQGEGVIRSWYASFGLPRISSTLGSPVAFGAYLTVMVPLLLGMSRFAGRRRTGLWALAAAAGIVATALTLTRAAWAGLIVGLVLFFLASGRAALRPWLVLLVLLAVALSAGLLVTQVGTPEQIGGRVTQAASVQTGSLATRVYIWQRTLGLVAQRPWLGWGPETLREVFPYDRTSLVPLFGARPVIVDKAHNDVLQMAVSVGLPGAAAYAAFWLTSLAAAWRIVRRTRGPERVLAAGWLGAVAGYLVQAQFSFSLVGVAPLVWVFAGAAAGWEADQRGR